jgi:hypothetical protein
MSTALSRLHHNKLLGITNQSKNQSFVHIVHRVQFFQLYVSEPETVSALRCKGESIPTHLGPLGRENR